MKLLTIAYIVAFLWLINLTCTNMVSGNTSETGNAAAVTGKIYEPEGKAPAAGVTVVIRGKKTLPMIEVNEPWNKKPSTDSVMTDDNGRYSFSGINMGEYVVYATRGNTGAMIEPVSVIDSEHTVYLPPDTLEALGSIRGKIVFNEGGNSGNTLVLVFGVNQYATVDSNGSFVLPELAEGMYNIKVVANTAYYESVDITGISVKPGKTTDIGSIEMPFNAVPKPRNVKLEFDTAKCIISLQWDRCDTAKVEKYFVVKRSYLIPEEQIIADSVLLYSYTEDTRYALINTDEFTDTCYKDSVIFDKNYFKYNIVAVDKNGNHSSYSDTQSCSSTPRFSLNGKRLLAFDGYKQLLPYSYEEITAANGRIYALWQNNISVLDNSLNPKILINIDDYKSGPKKIAVGESGEMFTVDISEVGNSDEASIYCYRNNGSLLRKIDDNTIRKFGAIDIDVKNGLLYVITGGFPKDGTVAFPSHCSDLYRDEFCDGGDSVIVYTYKGERVQAWKCSDGPASRWICINGNSKIFVSNGRETDEIRVFDKQGNLTSTITMPDFPSKNENLKLYPQAIDYDDKRNLLYVHVIAGENKHHMIFVFDDKNRYIGRFALPSFHYENEIYSLAVLENGSVVYLASGGCEARGFYELYWTTRFDPLF